jgi:hypothetical protein
MSKQTVRISRVINAPLRFAYDWWTDFRDTDMQIIGSQNRRIILEKTKKRVIYAKLSPAENGPSMVGVNIVTLIPYKSWHLEYFGEESNEIGDYAITRLGKTKTSLNLIFTETTKKGDHTMKEVENLVNNIWDHYLNALEKEYRERSKS